MIESRSGGGCAAGSLSRRSVLRAIGSGMGVLAFSSGPRASMASGRPTVVLAVDAITGNADPGMFVTFGDIMSIDCMGRGLTHVDFHSNTPKPAIASSWDISEDGRTYTFHLKPGLHFHDGTPLTAVDCKRTFARLMNRHDPSRPVGVYAIDELGGANLLSVEAIDQNTFRMKLAFPDVAFLSRLSRPNAVIISSAALDRLGPAIGQSLVSCGPFRFVSSEPGERVVLESFAGYYGGEPSIRRLVLQVMPDPLATVTALRSRSIQLSNVVPYSALPYLRSKPNLRVYTPKPYITVFLGMNAQSGPLRDMRIRQAINYSLDRKAIMHEVFLGSATQPAYMMTPSQIGYDDALVKFSTQDMPRSKELLRQVGIEGRPRLELLCQNHLFWPNLGQIVQRNLKEAGFDVTTTYVDGGTFSGQVVDPEKHQLFLDQRSAFMPDPDDKFTPLFGSGKRMAEYGTRHTQLPTQPFLDTLIAQAVRTSDSQVRIEIYRKINRYLAEEVMVHSVLAYVSTPVASVENLTGVNADALGTYRTFLEDLSFAG